MTSYESQTITLSKRKILLVTLVAVGILTFCYVLGVHVGRQSAALNLVDTKGAGEDLCKLPATIQDQIKTLDDVQDVRDLSEPRRSAQQSDAVSEMPKSVVDKRVILPVKTSVTMSSKIESRGSEKKTEEAVRWTTQIVSTPDLAEAQRTMSKVQTAGFSAVIISERGLFKVRLARASNREAVDALMAKLRSRGFKPFAIRVG